MEEAGLQCCYVLKLHVGTIAEMICASILWCNNGQQEQQHEIECGDPARPIL